MEFFSIPFNHRGVTKFFTNAFNETLEYREANNITRPDFMNLIMQLIKKGYVDVDGVEPTSITGTIQKFLTRYVPPAARKVNDFLEFIIDDKV